MERNEWREKVVKEDERMEKNCIRNEKSFQINKTSERDFFLSSEASLAIFRLKIQDCIRFLCMLLVSLLVGVEEIEPFESPPACISLYI